MKNSKAVDWKRIAKRLAHVVACHHRLDETECEGCMALRAYRTAISYDRALTRSRSAGKGRKKS